MNKIEKLLNELCPNGVEFKSLGEVANFRRGSFPQPYTKTEWYGGEDSAPFVQVTDVGDNMKLTETTKQTISKIAQSKSVFVPKNTVIVTLQGSIGRVAITQYDSYVDRTLAIFQSYKIPINIKFFAYVLFMKFDEEKKKARGGIIKTITVEEFKQFQIPIPPLEIQEEIVKILDAFTELEAELEARRRQYEYYRNKLLSFEYLKTNGGGSELKMLGEIGKFTRGNGLQKKDLLDSGIPCIHYGQIHTYYENYTHTTKSFVSAENAKKLKKAKKGDLVIAGASENIEDVCKAVVYLGESDVCISGDSFAFSHSLNPKYVGYVFQGEQFIEYKKKYAQGTKVMRLSIERLKQFQIPIPSLETQEKIVSILDKFHALTTDLQSGIPAEIEARKKQYEYYRNQLLTFKEAI